MAGDGRTKIAALKVPQWLPSWDDLDYDSKEHRRRPQPYFFLAAMPASMLRSLVGIYRRHGDSPGNKNELGIQRRHDVERSAEIREYVKNGFPWSQLSDQRRDSHEYDDLRKPGWLPTSIVVNILDTKDERRGKKIAAKDMVTVESDNSRSSLLLPKGFTAGKWKSSSIAPIEVIDGQHRLWAFNEEDEEEFELPVVAFQGLDISWQAYLFYSINITPKKINRSLAYDLYPLLRSEDWLERFEGAPVYRETRSQELTESLWAHPKSPWHQRINMLGERGRGAVTQAAWIRSLMATFVRTYSGRGQGRIGGLFGAPAGDDQLVLNWSSSQQAAFLIRIWQHLQSEIEGRRDPWMKALREEKSDQTPDSSTTGSLDLAFSGPATLLNTDQGVRGFLHVVNDLCFRRSETLGLAGWSSSASKSGIDQAAIDAELEGLEKTGIDEYLAELAKAAAPFDWRTSAAAGLGEQERREKARFRGSGGYKELRVELTEFLAAQAPEKVASAAAEVAELLVPNK